MDDPLPGVRGVRRIGGTTSVPDQTGEALYELVSSAPDRSSTSDDLAAHASDRAYRSELSRLRPNILLPLRIEPGMRVLDVGCGTGPLTRALAERGAQVTGLEAGLTRAKVAAARTAGLANCEIVSGDLSDLVVEGHRAEFDLILMVAPSGGSPQGPAVDLAATLRMAEQLLREHGAVVLAVENRLALKSLLGFPTGSRNLPWVGIDGVRSGREPSRMWLRNDLATTLSEEGFPEQRWLFPYPDHLFPAAVADADLFDTAEGRAILRLFVRDPIGDDRASSMVVADPVAALETLLAAGLGRDTANSFLVIASRAGTDPDAFVRPGSAWVSGPERRAELIDRRVIQQRDADWLVAGLDQRREVHLPPLVWRPKDAPVQPGRTLEDELVETAARARSPRELRPPLQEWWSAAMLLQQPAEFRPEVGPGAFVRTNSGALHYLDSGWLWTEEVPVSWALLRSLWHLVVDRLWAAGATAGLSWNLALGEMVLSLARVVEPSTEQSDLLAAIALESRLRAKWFGTDADEEESALLRLMGEPVALLAEGPPLAQMLERPFIADADAGRRERAAQLREMQAQDAILGNQAEMESLQWRVDELEAKLRWLRKYDPRGQVRRARRTAGRIKRRMLR